MSDAGDPRLFGVPVDREALLERVGALEQVVGVDVVEHVDGPARGVRVAQVRTGEIEFEVLLDRAADLGRASVRGVPIGWLSPTGIVAPGLVDAHEWGPLRSFGAGLLTTCGLDQAYAPTTDDVSGFGRQDRLTAAFPMHGRLSGVPARLCGYGVAWDAPQPYVHLDAEVRQAALFGERLTLERRIEAPLGGRAIHIRDRVRNDGYARTPHAIVYHVNCGWPVVAPGTEIVVASRARGVGHELDWRVVPDDLGAAERVWQHDIVARDGIARAAIVREDLGDARAAGLFVRYEVAELPYFVQWLAQGRGHRVGALEPSNLPIEGRVAARERGQLVELEPSEERIYRFVLRLLHGAEDVADVRGLLA